MLALQSLLFAAIAAYFGLIGTNAQAALAKQRLLADTNPLIAWAGRLWRPGFRWLARPARRHQRQEMEAKLREDAAEWARYDRLRRELWAWNAVESGVAMAFAGALSALAGVLLSL